MFPVSFEGKVEVGPLPPTGVILGAFEQRLSAARARNISRSASGITFGVGLVGFNWDLLAPVDLGQVEVLDEGPRVVHYDFSCRRLLLLATAATLFVGFGGRNLLVAVAAWLWLFGMNYLVGALRLHFFVKRTIRLAVGDEAEWAA